MKKSLLTLIAILVWTAIGFSQTDVQLNIHHKLGDSNFALNTSASNNLDHDFNATRLEYYISEISIVHDGGTETAINDLWILADASEGTSVDLGNHNMTQIESIKFHIGVDIDHNHEDPASYPSDHPLAPQAPSMHWGWTSGYRFIAYEGKGGSNLDQTCELHGLGDINYFQTEVALDITAENNSATIHLDADYTRMLEDISVSGGVIVHGDNDEAQQALENMRDYVFTESSMVTSTVDFSEINGFDIYPNPTTLGHTTLLINSSEDLTYQITVTDLLGRQIKNFDSVNSNNIVDLRLDNAGLYLVNLIKEGQVIISQKLVVE